jgi:RimJ/RimL family protein N-acetyltransferase
MRPRDVRQWCQDPRMLESTGPDACDRDNGVSVRPWRPDEAAVLAAMCDDPEVAVRTPLPTPFSMEHAQTFIEGRRGYVDLAIVGVDDSPVGLVSLNLATQSASYVVSAAARGRGFATRALGRVWGMATTDLGWDRVTLEIEPGNRASESVAERCGFQPDGSSERVEDKGREYDLSLWERHV